MIILDSNIIIYSALPEYSYLRTLVKVSDAYTSLISKLEVLGFNKLDKNSIVYFESVFYSLNVLPISDRIIDNAILLRKQRKLTIGDAIIASTALNYDFELHTRNLANFEYIPTIRLKNPIV